MINSVLVLFRDITAGILDEILPVVQLGQYRN